MTDNEIRELVQDAIADHERRFIGQALLMGALFAALGCVLCSLWQHPDMMGELLAYWG